MMFWKDEGPTEEMGGLIVCVEVCLGVVLTSSLVSCDDSILSG